MPAKLLVASCVRQDATVLSACLATLGALDAPPGCSIEYAFVDDNAELKSTEVLAAFICEQNVAGRKGHLLHAEARPSDAHYAVGAVTHEWSTPTFVHLAKQKQRLLDLAAEGGYAAVLMVDSDLLLAPSTLRCLWLSGLPVVSGVFWTSWTPDAPPLPQTWLRHPYELSGLGMEQHEYLGALKRMQAVRVAGGGACVLIRTQHIVSGAAAYWPLIEGLPSGGMWQGEDRSFAIRLEGGKVRQYADAWPHIEHAYHPWQRAADELEATRAAVMCSTNRTHGFVSLRIDPLEDPELEAQLEPHLRLWRGSVSEASHALLPELASALRTMGIGESRYVTARWPLDTPMYMYAGQERMLQLTLIDAR